MDPFSDELKCHDISDIQGTGGYVEVPVEKEGASEPRHAFGKVCSIIFFHELF